MKASCVMVMMGDGEGDGEDDDASRVLFLLNLLMAAGHDGRPT